MPSTSYGGQALIEGVLMRGRDALAVALRHPDGGIVWATERFDAGFHASRWAKLPLIRGLVVLYETLVVGTRWLVRSASLSAAEEGVELGSGSVAIMLLVTLAAGIGIFFLLPLFLASATVGRVDNGLVQHLVEGLFRIAIFVGYLLLIARTPDVRRVFQYHGAEHMTIHALEHGDPLVPAAIRKYPTAHPRCGTEFLVVVIIMSILAFSLVGRQDAVAMVASRVLLIPIIVALSYELLRFTARHRGNRLVRWFAAPGIWVQAITTRQPTDDMIEVAIVSMEQALLADGESLPAGSGTLAREPLEAAEARTRALLAAKGTVEAQATGEAEAAGEPGAASEAGA
ncbi:MAG: DUF1385 domain-containing protein, partial [Candidatus Limnocylindrales bacterium]